MISLWLAWAPASAAPSERVRIVDHGARGAVHLVTETLDGIDVDVVRRERFDATGHLVEVRQPEVPPPWRVGAPLPATRALEVARARFGLGPDARARLSWIPDTDRLHLTWTIDAGGPVPGLPQHRPMLRLEATTGLLLGIDEGAVTQDADVFLTNPVLQPDPQRVTLPLATSALSDARMEMLQCRDEGQVDTWYFGGQYWDFHVCTDGPADGPTGGDYLYAAVPYPTDPARDEDRFAGPHTYHNLHVGLDWFEALGWVPNDGFDPRVYITLNRRVTDMWSAETAGDPAMPLDPYNNAYSSGGYTDWQDEWVAPVLVFGQGDAVDYAYDADVIHHELGHYIVKSQDGPSWSYDTIWGPSVQANALNEGIADYFSSAIQGDGQLAEYAASDRGTIRDLDAFDTCMSDLFGESHYDGLPVAQALWAVRQGLPPMERPVLDQVVLDGLALMGRNPDFTEAADTWIGLLDEALSKGPLLADAFDARGVRDCRPLVPISAGPDAFRHFTYVPGSSEYSTLGPKPGYLQFVVDVPAQGGRLLLEFDQTKFLGLDPYESNSPRELQVVGQLGDQILWFLGEAEVEIEDNGETYTFLVDTWTTGAETVAVTAHVGVDPNPDDNRYEDHHYAALWDVPVGGTYVFQLTNPQARTATARDLTLTIAPIPEPVPVDTGEAVATGKRGDGEDPAMGCACASGSAGGAWVGVLGLLAVRRPR